MAEEGIGNHTPCLDPRSKKPCRWPNSNFWRICFKREGTRRVSYFKTAYGKCLPCKRRKLVAECQVLEDPRTVARSVTIAIVDKNILYALITKFHK